MERSSKRGKIPQQDWPSIIARYEAGETLSSIARTYDCSPPAISYIVSRTRTRNAAQAAVVPSTQASSEPQLVKGHITEVPVREVRHGEGIADETRVGNRTLSTPHRVEGPAAETSPIEIRPFPEETSRAPDLPNDLPLREGNGLAEQYLSGPDSTSAPENSPRSFDSASVPSPNNELRRTLHLSLPHANDVPPEPDPQDHGGHGANVSGEQIAPRPAGSHQGFGQAGRQGRGQYPPAGNGAPSQVVPEPQRIKEGTAFIDQALRERVEGDIAAFLAAFDAALARDTSESRIGLREATDRLLRAGARTRIELERLEARVPLPSRNDGSHPEPTWRQR